MNSSSLRGAATRQRNAVLRDLTQNNNSLGSVANATIASNQSAMTNSVPTAGDVRVTTRSVTWTLLQSSSAKE
jgi:hypothetical protein